ncbi:MAG: hypothetical protein AAB414_01295 [Patescibacteria group bacterium]
MEDGKWLRLVIIGLVLAAMAVGYFLLAQRFTGTKVSQSQTRVAVNTPSPALSPSPISTSTPTPVIPAIPTPLPSPVSQSGSAYQRIVDRTKGGVQVLPATGSPMVLVGIFSVGAAVLGWHLRKFSR